MANYLHDSKPTLLFIPDISGFTEFVSETDMVHSRHIIEELLEELIDANEIGLKISEIEGDAILFYREGKAPTAAELLSQLQRMFVKFHAHLKKYESHRICQCGACSSAHNLSLKFVIHYGDISKKQVKEFSKLFGKEVIVAHRLMKNKVPHQEYALFTNALIEACGTWKHITQISWDDPKNLAERYDFGDIEYSYLPLEPLRKQVPEPEIADFSESEFKKHVLQVEHMVEAPMEAVFSALSDLSFRGKWQLGVMEEPELDSHINRIGAVHRCIANGPLLYTGDLQYQKDRITYVETDAKVGSTVFTLRKIGKGLTSIQMDLFVKNNLIIQLGFRLQRKKFRRRIIGSFENLGNYCRSLYLKGEEHPYSLVLKKSDNTENSINRAKLKKK